MSYYSGATFGWTGTDLTGAVKSGTTYSFTYNDEGIRTAKTKSGVTTAYYLSGSQIVAEETSGNLTVYIYDAEGLPLGMRYHGAAYAEDVWDVYWYEKNIFGDVVAVYNSAGTKLISYKYDAFGKATRSYHNSGGSTTATKNPFRYRGYYYDQDLQLYYLNSRYYDGYTGRFISPDSLGYLGANGDLNSYNLYAYCSNNPVNFADPSGHSITALILCGIALIGMGLTIGGVATDNNVMTAIGLTMVAVPAMISGVGAIVSGSVGAPILFASGVATTVAGVGTGVFASAEYQEAFVGDNWMSGALGEDLYNGLMLATAAIATAGTVVSSIGALRYNNMGKYWLNGRKAMRSHFLNHGRDMGYRNVFDYTNGARAVVNKGGVYASKANAYTQWIAGKKYFFVGLGRNSNLITTYFIKTISYTKYLSIL